MTFRSASLAALTAASVALAPAATPAKAVTPRSGTYVASLPEGGELGFKLGSLSKRIVRISGTATLTCSDGTTVTDTWDEIVFGPKTSRRFTYRGDGLVLTGRFTTARRAKGTLERRAGTCSTTGLKWTARQKAS